MNATDQDVCLEFLVIRVRRVVGVGHDPLVERKQSARLQHPEHLRVDLQQALRVARRLDRVDLVEVTLAVRHVMIVSLSTRSV